MGMGFDEAYDLYISQDNESFYREYTQNALDFIFDDSTLVRKVKEEKYPFNGEYIEYECHIDTISDVSVNTTKVSGNYLSLIFRDCLHKNRRGQKYLYEDKPYLCFDKTEDLSEISRTKIIKCNNKISWIDKASGKIITEPIFIGFELSATNSNTTKDSTVEQRRLICLIQGNKYTRYIEENQRFLLSKTKAFKVTQVYDINLDDISEEYSSMITLYIEWSSANLPYDNLDLLIADYYDRVYTLSINSTDLSLLPSVSGQLSATVKLNDIVQSNVPLKWATSNENVIEIDELGNYQVVGLSGSTALITCYIDGNDNVYDSIDVNITSTPIINKEIRINPSVSTKILQGSYLDVSYGVYDGDVLTSDIVTVTPSGVNASNYTLTYSSGKVRVANILKSTNKLTLTFSSGSLSNKTLELTLGGII